MAAMLNFIKKKVVCVRLFIFIYLFLIYLFLICLFYLFVMYVQLGTAEERPPSATVAGDTGEEAAHPDTSHQLQAVPHHGDQPQGN